jgi:hypothetical protein
MGLKAGSILTDDVGRLCSELFIFPVFTGQLWFMGSGSAGMTALPRH